MKGSFVLFLKFLNLFHIHVYSIHTELEVSNVITFPLDMSDMSHLWSNIGMDIKDLFWTLDSQDIYETLYMVTLHYFNSIQVSLFLPTSNISQIHQVYI